jgi:hypothetical protein
MFVYHLTQKHMAHTPNTLPTPTPETNPHRNEVNFVLPQPYGAPRNAVGLENVRVDELLNESWVDPYAGQSKVMALGRKALSRATSYEPQAPYAAPRPWLEAAQQERAASVKDELDRTRNLIQMTVLEGVDDIRVDRYLGLRAKDSILPPLLLDAHHAAEQQQGKEISFLQWMSGHASDEQLLNTLQWHDSYLERLDTAPEFLEKVNDAKQGYQRGVQLAIDSGELHPSMQIDEDQLHNMRIVHASPLAPYTADTNGTSFVGRNFITVSPDAEDRTLYHELSHALKPGFNGQFTEGATELVTRAIYNQAHPGKEYDLTRLAYDNQLRMLATMNHLTGGALNTYELSRIYAGPDQQANTQQLIDAVDGRLEFAVLKHTLQAAQEVADILHPGYSTVASISDAYTYAAGAMKIFESIFLKEGKLVTPGAESVIRHTQAVHGEGMTDTLAIECAKRAAIGAILEKMASQAHEAKV